MNKFATMNIIVILLLQILNLNHCYTETEVIDWCNGVNEEHDKNVQGMRNEWLGSNIVHNVLPSSVEPKYIIDSKIRVEKFTTCVRDCCILQSCHVAFYVSKTCLFISCPDVNDQDACKPIKKSSVDDDGDYGNVGPTYWITVRKPDVRQKQQPISTTTTSTTKAVNKSCELGLPDTCNSAFERCIPKNGRTRAGVCVCTLGYIRNISSGMCAKEETRQPIVASSTADTATTTTTTATSLKTSHLSHPEVITDLHSPPSSHSSVVSATVSATSTTTTSTTTSTTSKTLSTATSTIIFSTVIQIPSEVTKSDHTLHLPLSVLVINKTKVGSIGNEDVRYLWTVESSSPSEGEILNESDQSSVLQMSKIVVGCYNFTVQIWFQSRNASFRDSVVVHVFPDPFERYLVSLQLNIHHSNFTRLHLDRLKAQLLLLLNTIQPSNVGIVIRSVSHDPITHQAVVNFYVVNATSTTTNLNNGNEIDSNIIDYSKIWKASDVVDSLEEKLRVDSDLIDLKVIKFRTNVCENACSNHGSCDEVTRACVCDWMWVENFIKRRAGHPNCDWSVVNIGLFAFLLLLVVAFLSCCVVCLMKKLQCSKAKLRNKYKMLSMKKLNSRSSKNEMLFQDNEDGFLMAGMSGDSSADDGDGDDDIFVKRNVISLNNKPSANKMNNINSSSNNNNKSINNNINNHNSNNSNYVNKVSDKNKSMKNLGQVMMKKKINA